MVEISIKRVDPELPLPSYAHPGDAGADLHSAVDVTLAPGERALVPTGIALFIRQLTGNARVSDALVTSVGLVVAMVPEGLILLTSVAFTVGVVRLARRRTLVKELAAMEGPAASETA